MAALPKQLETALCRFELESAIRDRSQDKPSQAHENRHSAGAGAQAEAEAKTEDQADKESCTRCALSGHRLGRAQLMLSTDNLIPLKTCYISHRNASYRIVSYIYDILHLLPASTTWRNSYAACSEWRLKASTVRLYK